MHRFDRFTASSEIGLYLLYVAFAIYLFVAFALPWMYWQYWDCSSKHTREGGSPVKITRNLAAAILWIAENDETRCMDPETVAMSVTVLLVSDVYEVQPEWVAKHVVDLRKRHTI